MQERKISWSTLNPAGIGKKRLTSYTLFQSKRPGTVVNDIDWPYPERSIRNGIIRKTASK